MQPGDRRVARAEIDGPGGVDSADERLEVFDELGFDLHIPGGLSHIHRQEQHRDKQGLDCGRRDVLEPLADADADREVRRASLNGDRQRAVCVYESGEESSFPGLDDRPQRARC
jgi:hypothetical protein